LSGWAGYFAANFGFSDRLLRDIQAKLLEHIAKLCRAWEEMHGRA
jgi:hypothetical protein